MPEDASVLFIMLDATRADRLSAWGNTPPTTPTLDGLAAAGALFRRHFANSHATRPSFPQLMTGRYYFQNVLRAFTPNEHPREFPFSLGDPTAAFVPAVLHGRGFQTVGVSAHPWFVSASDLGRHFDRLELVAAEATRGYADARDVVDRARTVWLARDPSRPVFLYVHFMDMHMPRHLPDGEPRVPVPGYDWRRRFKPSGEPLFHPERRRWLRADARDFSELDRRHFAAVYDSRLAHADAQLGRLLAAVRADDPDLRRTLVVVASDHGEELGEDGRTDHTDSLTDGVQHVPWIVAGAGVAPAQTCERFTENIDVGPTLLELLGVPLPAGTRMDGRAQLGRDGRLGARAGKPAVYYAWEGYRAIRTQRHLLRENIPGSFAARREGEVVLYRLEGAERVRLPIEGRAIRVLERLRARLDRRLARREARFLRARYETPRTPFFVRAEFWRLAPETRVTCVPIDAATGRRALRVRGWLWSGRGVTVLRPGDGGPLPVTVSAPDGVYEVEAAARPIDPMPRLLGFGRWRRESFASESATVHVALGAARSVGGRLSVAIPASAAAGRHIVGLRRSPPGFVAEAGGEPGPEDEELRVRLQALGYVE